ncbi:MAG: MerR family transcriptional regulator [Pseudobutyrivibrio sp.]|nr:MerR family transcriptional regulator [Pseudobutyrivibrio sp.]
MADSKTYTIKEVTKLTGNVASTLRYYESLGLLEHVGRDANDNRIYTDEHLDRLEGIKCFKDGAMPLEKIKEFYSYESNLKEHIDDILSLVKEQTGQLADTIAKMEAQKDHMEKKVRYYTAVREAINENRKWPSWDEI